VLATLQKLYEVFIHSNPYWLVCVIVQLVFQRVGLDSLKSHNNMSKLTACGSRRPETPEFCKVKLLFSSNESSGFKVGSASVPCGKGLS